jgi:glycosyltransferase involved in cell wall biosynthesis
VGHLNKSRLEDCKRLESAFGSATVFCMPTEFEPFDIAFVEAMYWGLPCIGPDVWAFPEIVRHGVTRRLTFEQCEC